MAKKLILWPILTRFTEFFVSFISASSYRLLQAINLSNLYEK